MCEVVTKLLLQFSPTPIIECTDPAGLTFEEQIYLVNKATIVIANHGTTGHTALFARSKTVLITLGRGPFKEAQILHTVTHIYPMHVNIDDNDWKRYLSSFLLRALNFDSLRGITTLRS